ncbi:MAG: sigma-70 family RNA polymerase sigma factor [Clostridia bacterium]|nr:sigma-70 family RNA polymerase sigma factor [Clostridia bacterium]
MESYGSEVKRLCCLYMTDLSLAEDAAQETFIKAWRSLARFRGDCSERTWLMHIAVNTCRDMLRTSWFRRMDRSVTPDELPLTAPAPQEPELAQAIIRLPQREREAIILRYYQLMSAMEIAHMLNVPVSTVKSRLNRAQKKLRTMLEGWDDDE